MNRRALLSLSLAWVVSAAALSGCGFALKGQQAMPFRTAALQGFAGNSGMATELANALERAGVKVVETTAEAAAQNPPGTNASTALQGHVIFEAQSDLQDQSAASVTAYRQIRDMNLRTRLQFRLLRADGSVLLPSTDLQLNRTVPYNEKDALARQDEFEAIHRTMQADLIEQVMRRLATVRP